LLCELIEMADAAADDRVRGSAEMIKQAAAGLELLKGDATDVEGDVAAATAYKAEIDAKHAQLEAEAAALTGKDNKKARSEKSKEATAMKRTSEYIDAERVVKGLAPKHGHFVKAGQAAPAKAAPAVGATAPPAAEEPAKAAAAKDDKKKDSKKKVESAGISPAERQELEKLKADIIARKASLKEGGMSGGQINKDAEIVAWVARMNELKEKESPGSTTAGKDDKKAPKKKALGSEAAKEVETLEKEIEEYRQKLKSEFGYSNKDINVDPDMVDMQAKLKQLKK
jgi:hypothetical protein